jgi:hypothetical protein
MGYDDDFDVALIGSHATGMAAALSLSLSTA